MKKQDLRLYLFALIGMTKIASCTEPKSKLLDTPTSGHIAMTVDETYQPVISSEQMVFESTYAEAHIHIQYKPAVDVMADLELDSIRGVITSTPADSLFIMKFFEKKGYYPKSTILAKDAVAVVSNNAHKDLKISVNELAQICEGKITHFEQLKNKNGSGKITLVFDHQKSSTTQYIIDSVLKGKAMSSNVYAQKTNTQVLEYIQKNPNALGIVGVNWISDSKDEETLAFAKNISPVQIAATDTSLYYYSPHPGYIAAHMYPLRRYMYSTIKEGGAALGIGFVNFITGDIGQRIVLKAGLVPAHAVTRVVQTRTQL